MQNTEMIMALSKIEDEMSQLLRDDKGWLSLNINYHPPFVERLWRQHGDYRIYLHRIAPCSRAEALLHPHPWPSAMRVLEGSYEMGIGYGDGPEPPPIAFTTYQRVVGDATGEALFVYEMIQQKSWHYVRSVNGPCYSVMVSGKPWADALKVGPEIPKLGPLPAAVHHELIEYFRGMYPEGE